MESRRFDALTRALTVAASRRGLLSAVVTFPFAGGLTAFLGDEEAEAQGRRKRRKKRHKHGKGRHRGGRRRRKHKNKKHKGQRDTCDVCASGCPYTAIQDAIDDPAGPTTIRLCAETYGETLRITKNLTLRGVGDGDDGTVLDGQGVAQTAVIDDGPTVAMEQLRITGGSAGGVFVSDGTLALTACTITGNSDAVGGGGIYAPNPESIVTLTNCTVSDNTVGGGGGGIYSPDGSVTLNNSRVSGNVAGTSGGGIYNPGGTIILNDSIVTENEAPGGGGGIYSPSGTVDLNGSSVVCGNEPDQCLGFSNPNCLDTCPA